MKKLVDNIWDSAGVMCLINSQSSAVYLVATAEKMPLCAGKYVDGYFFMHDVEEEIGGIFEGDLEWFISVFSKCKIVSYVEGL